jgi:hypothetical protein
VVRGPRGGIAEIKNELSYVARAFPMKKPVKRASTESPAKQLTGFIAKFDPAVARLIRSSRLAMRKRFPTANELVYDNYNFLAVGFGSTERTSDCIFSLVENAKGVSLFFYYRAKLEDPHKILFGSGNQVRFIRLKSAATCPNRK